MVLQQASFAESIEIIAKAFDDNNPNVRIIVSELHQAILQNSFEEFRLIIDNVGKDRKRKNSQDQGSSARKRERLQSTPDMTAVRNTLDRRVKEYQKLTEQAVGGHQGQTNKWPQLTTGEVCEDIFDHFGRFEASKDRYYVQNGILFTILHRRHELLNARLIENGEKYPETANKRPKWKELNLTGQKKKQAIFTAHVEVGRLIRRHPSVLGHENPMSLVQTRVSDQKLKSNEALKLIGEGPDPAIPGYYWLEIAYVLRSVKSRCLELAHCMEDLRTGVDKLSGIRDDATRSRYINDRGGIVSIYFRQASLISPDLKELLDSILIDIVEANIKMSQLDIHVRDQTNGALDTDAITSNNFFTEDTTFDRNLFQSLWVSNSIGTSFMTWEPFTFSGSSTCRQYTT